MKPKISTIRVDGVARLVTVRGGDLAVTHDEDLQGAIVRYIPDEDETPELTAKARELIAKVARAVKVLPTRRSKIPVQEVPAGVPTSLYDVVMETVDGLHVDVREAVRARATRAMAKVGI